MFESIWPNKQSDIDRGLSALKIFHNYSIVKYPQNYQIDFSYLQDLIRKQNKFAIEGIGLQANSIEISDSQLDDAMKKLADSTKGKIPNWQAFGSAMSGRIQDFSYMEAATYTTTETAKDLAKGAQEVGNVAIDTFKSLGMFLPIIVVGGLAFYVYNKAKG